MPIAGQKFWILGASQGIGRALASELHGRGAEIVVSARSADDLADLAGELGEGCRAEAVDVTDLQALKQLAEKLFQGEQRPDSVIYMAAAYQPMKLGNLDAQAVERILDVNLAGALNLVQAVFPRMLDAQQGQFVLCGSVAGYVGLPSSQPYACTKAAIINLAESLYLEGVEAGVDVKVINPGFVRTRMTDMNNFSMPAIMEVDQAASRIVRGLERRAFEIHFPRRFTWGLKLLQLMPRRLYFWLMRRSLKSQ